MALESRPLGESFAREDCRTAIVGAVGRSHDRSAASLMGASPGAGVSPASIVRARVGAVERPFRPTRTRRRTEWASPVVPEIGLISNLKDGQAKPIGGLGDGELQWHSDQSYMMKPATGAALYAVELPPEGGTTSWVDLAAAYAALPGRLKRPVDGRQAVFSYVKRLAGYQGVDRSISAEAKRKTPPVLHPLVHSHPVTGRKALYLDSTTTVGIAGMDAASGAALLDEIYCFATRPEFVYRHAWQVGDVVMWDNGVTMHRREPFDPAARRLMKRTTIFLSRERHIVPNGCLATEEAMA
jgi:taurine dioxygenase